MSNEQDKKPNRRNFLKIMFGTLGVMVAGGYAGKTIHEEVVPEIELGSEEAQKLYKKIRGYYDETVGLNENQKQQYAKIVTTEVMKELKLNGGNYIWNALMSYAYQSTTWDYREFEKENNSYTKIGVAGVKDAAGLNVITGIFAGAWRKNKLETRTFGKILEQNKFPLHKLEELSGDIARVVTGKAMLAYPGSSLASMALMVWKKRQFDNLEAGATQEIAPK